MRKRILLAAIAAIMGTAVAMAQQIAVVSESGSTDVYQTLQEAIEGASNGSVIYLPGGGFQIADSVKITKRLSIIGIGHKAKTENADGNTMIGGNLFFNEGSSGSSVMGCFISGTVHIGNDGKAVNNVSVKYCNLNNVNVTNSLCSGTFINQNYIRNGSGFENSSATFTNNIAHSIYRLANGVIANNILIGSGFEYGGWWFNNNIVYSDNNTISNNIILSPAREGILKNCNNCVVSGNMCPNVDWGDDPVNLAIDSWETVFTKYNGGAISPASDFHFTADYQQYSDCGIYGGTGFSDGALPPVPFIVSKSIPEQTDASGKLNIKIRVKAGE